MKKRSQVIQGIKIRKVIKYDDRVDVVEFNDGTLFSLYNLNQDRSYESIKDSIVELHKHGVDLLIEDGVFDLVDSIPFCFVINCKGDLFIHGLELQQELGFYELSYQEKKILKVEYRYHKRFLGYRVVATLLVMLLVVGYGFVNGWDEKGENAEQQDSLVIVFPEPDVGKKLDDQVNNNQENEKQHEPLVSESSEMILTNNQESDKERCEKLLNSGIEELKAEKFELAKTYFVEVATCNDGLELEHWVKCLNHALDSIERSGDEYYLAELYDNAISEYHKLRGVHKESSFKIGCCYHAKGKYKLAATYYEEAYNSGHGLAPYYLALLWDNGKLSGTFKYNTLDLYLHSAKKRSISAMDSCAMIYDRRGDYQQAFEWFDRSKEKSSMAKYKIACYYFDGKFVKRNVSKGMDILRELVAMKYAPAQYYMGLIYYEGEYNIPIDKGRGRYFIWLASNQQYEPAVKLLKMLNRE